MKQIEIIYQPGYGGNFLTYLFSLDPSTVPYWVDSDDVAERLRAYDFGNTEKYTDWKAFHEYGQKKFPRDHHDTMVSCRHAQKYIEDTDKFKPEPHKTYYQVDLSYSDWANYWLISSKKRLGQKRLADFPPIWQGEILEEKRIKLEYAFPIISIDCFLDLTQWENEYQRVNELMGLPLQLASARQYYQSWYCRRVETLRNDFAKLTSEQKNRYQVQRYRDEQCEPFVHSMAVDHAGGSRDRAFVKRYCEIKQSAWPNCESEKDFDQLPEAIKKELIEVFNYTPKEEFK
jgi:hypothetical protein